MERTEREPYLVPTPEPPPRADASDGADLAEEAADHERTLRWRTPLALFLLTLASTFYIGASSQTDVPYPDVAIAAAMHGHAVLAAGSALLGWVATGWSYAVPLLVILLCHEFGHYVMARRHRVPATLPMFIPVPLPPFGTLGAVIKMRDRIQTRDALLDIGAAGPLAGILVALPITYVGLRLSPVLPNPRTGEWMQEGTSVIYALLKYIAKGTIAPDQDVLLHPMAKAGWVGMFVTMINLIPYGQLDGGHVAYALLHHVHDKFARWVIAALLALGVGTGLYWGRTLAAQHHNPWVFGTGYTQGFNWFVFAILVWTMHRGTRGLHPPTDDGTLSPVRRVVAVCTLALFALLFMPVPLRFNA